VSTYKVIGKWRYREYTPGEIFIANLESDVEARAVKAGAIEVLERADTKLDPKWATPPRAWTATA